MKVVVFANGDRARDDVVRRCLASASLVICADGGIDHADAGGVRPDVVIGDLDSLPPQRRAMLASQGVEFVVHPADKDETDLELALLFASDRGATQITVLGALGRRIDHELGNLLLLAHPRLQGIDIRVVSSSQEVTLIHRRETFDGEVGDLLSLLPVGGDATGITTSGLKYPLVDETLYFGPARGVSNVFTIARPTVSVRSGLLFAIHTHAHQEANSC